MKVWPVLLSILGALLSGGAYFAGVRAERAAWEARVAREKLADAEATQRLLARTAEVTGAADAAVLASQERIRVVSRIIHDKVPVYVPAEADAGCTVTVGAVRLLNAAAEGRAPDADDPAQPNAAPSGVALSTVVDVTADNYGICLADQDRLSKLQQLLRDLGMAPPVTAAAP